MRASKNSLCHRRHEGTLPAFNSFNQVVRVPSSSPLSRRSGAIPAPCSAPWAAQSSNPSTRSPGIRSARRSLKEMDAVALSNRQSSDLPFRRKATTYTLQQQTLWLCVSVCVSVSVSVRVWKLNKRMGIISLVCARACVCVRRRTLPQAKVIEQLRSSCYTPG